MKRPKPYKRGLALSGMISEIDWLAKQIGLFFDWKGDQCLKSIETGERVYFEDVVQSRKDYTS